MPNEQRKAVKSGCAFLCLLSFTQVKESTVAHGAKTIAKTAIPNTNNINLRNIKKAYNNHIQTKP
ncbi:MULTISPECIES: hypothetical protein [unclassified Lonepinella]|uniref:hypothetical protein n=1 Tax=unclassified Lonepinella TaxID=2642006 RepID=UPI0036DB3D07